MCALMVCALIVCAPSKCVHWSFVQVYEPWMDTPRALLSVEQRKAMAELEKRAMEATEECEKATRQLEMERKAVEVGCRLSRV